MSFLNSLIVHDMLFYSLPDTTVNPGYPVSYRRSGASHGGTGGRVTGQTQRTMTSYGDLYEPKVFGSTGGIGYHSNSYGGNGGGIIWMNVTGWFWDMTVNTL